ncbi:MAG: D-alanine--D-alanine ligase [Ktedonobacteraceae bacterium]
MSQKKLRVGLVFGGRSGEHEVSLASARAVMEQLDPATYDVVPIGITRAGTWLLGTSPDRLLASGQSMALEGQEDAGGATNIQQPTSVTFTSDPTVGRLIPLQSDVPLGDRGAIDVIFPVLHGTYGEDGTLQGMLEMANIPYVGCGVLGSALGMDKEKMKMVFASAGLPNVNYIVFRRSNWERDPRTVLDKIEQQIGYPNFVKPVNLGSSVGVNKAHNREELSHALNVAAEYDHKIIIEQGIDCRECECAVLGNDEPIASVVGEVVASNEFYDYNAKYIDNKSRVIIPAELPSQMAQEIRRYAVEAFLALDLSGLARVDFFIEKETGKVYINEVNTLPGFTQISMYPKLWEASGVPYAELLDRLIALGLERHADRQRNRTSL